MQLVEELFQAQDSRFIYELRKCADPKALAPFADRWKQDARPWAREQIIAYLEAPLDCIGHQPVVKRLFKHAEQAGDDELMAAFLVAFDRLVRRERRTRWRYDWSSRQSWQEETLASPRNTLPASAEQFRGRNPRTGEITGAAARLLRNGRLFRYATRKYLRRRAWRYFRRMGFQRPGDYPQAIALALQKYRDEDLARGESLLDCWGLMNACYRHHEALEFNAHSPRVKEGRSLAELTPAPRFVELWRKPESLSILLGLTMDGQSRLMRLWAMDLVRREQRQNLSQAGVEILLRLLDHSDPEAQQFGVELLEQSPALATLPIDVWLRLLSTRNPTAVAMLCELMKRHVARERLTLEQCVELACSQATPVAQMGFDFLRQFAAATPEDRALIARLARARCDALGHEIALWALPIVGSREHYDRDAVTGFFDSLNSQVRDGAWQWLAGDSAASNDPVVYVRLLETPFDDLRLRLVDELQRKSSLPGVGAHDLTPLWCSVLLGVQRGGRQKPKAVAQLAEALIARPEWAAELLPVLAAAVRSVRAAERRAGLAAVVQVTERRPELTDAVARSLPELSLAVEGAL